jgi:arylamine N-acetyltransferase
MRRSGIDARTVAAYLKRLRIDDPGEPSVAALRALHRAHVERVPYEVLEIQLGRPSTVDPVESVARVLRGRGGYCVQLNGAFATLLTALGYHVLWHEARVQASAAPLPPDTPSAPHLAPTVTVEGETWLVDVGLGDGLHDPLPLHSGTYRQGPFTYRLAASRTVPDGWRFDHDPRGSIVGMDVAMAPARREEFARWHHYLSTSPESRLVRAPAVMRRDPAGVDSLVGCMLRRVDASGRTERELATPDDWYGALTDLFGLRLTDVDAAERGALWRRVRGGHERWLARRAKRVS